MSTALALIQPTEYDLMAKLATIAAKSGYSKQTEVQAMFIMLKGYELGISPMQALDGIQVIQGKTTVSPQLMLALINRSGQLEDIKIDPTDTECTVMMKRVGRSPHTETFTSDNAQSMGLWSKDNWKKQPAVMLKWRAVSACARIVFPDVIQGVYSPEEMGAEVSENESGDIVIVTPPTPTLPANVDTETGEIMETPLTVVDTPQSNENAVSSDVPASPALTVSPTPETPAKTPAQRLGNGNGKKTIAPQKAPTPDEVREFTAYQVRRLGTADKPVYKIETKERVQLTAYSRDIFRSLGYTDEEMKDWPNVGFVGALKTDHKVKGQWKVGEKFGMWEVQIPLPATVEESMIDFNEVAP